MPTGRYDVPLVIQAKQYAANGELVSPENERTSLYGDVIHVVSPPPEELPRRLLDMQLWVDLTLCGSIEWTTLAIFRS